VPRALLAPLRDSRAHRILSDHAIGPGATGMNEGGPMGRVWPSRDERSWITVPVSSARRTVLSGLWAWLG